MTRGIGRQFLLETQYRYMDVSDQRQGLPQPPLHLAHDADRPRIDLPAPREIAVPETDLRAVLERRRTLRAYSPAPLSLGELAWLLWATQGVERVLSAGTTLRPAPSAGARHAFETWLLINRVEGLEPGLYRYLALEHQVQRLPAPSDIAGRLATAATDQGFLKESAATFIWVAQAYRMTWRYNERGYRYLLLDAGHVCQNLYLAAEAIGCGACAVGAYDDEAVNRLLGLDGDELFVIYMAPVGKRPR
jgi:SagB-type dehydrogenase family enzyme